MENNNLIPIPGYGKKYLINTLGEVYSNPKNRFLKPTLSVKGYYVLTLSKKIRYLHQLVAETFLDASYKSKNLFVDHIDRNPKNNSLHNLRLVTKSENGLNVDRPFKLCIFKREDNGKFRVIRRRTNQTFKTFDEAYKFRMKLEEAKQNGNK